MTSRPFPTVTVRDLVAILFRHRWAIVSVFLLTFFALGFYLLAIREEGYTAGTKLLVRLGREQSSQMSNLKETAAPILTYRYQEVNSELEILKNINLLADVSDYFHMEQPAPAKPVPPGFIPRARAALKGWVKTVREWYDETLIWAGLRDRIGPREAAIDRLSHSFDAVMQKDSNVILVTLTLPFREGGGAVLNKLLELYQLRRLKAYTDATAEEFFRNQTEKRAAELQAVEEKLKRFEQSTGILSIETQKTDWIAEETKLTDRLADARLRESQIAAKLMRFEAEMKKPEPDIALAGGFERETLPANLMLQLTAIQRDREQLRLTNLDSSDRIQNNRRQFQVVLGLVQSHLRSVLSEIRSEVTARETELEKVRTSLDRLQASQMEWLGLKRSVKLLEDSYVYFGTRHREALASEGMGKSQIGSVVVLDPALDAVLPSGIRKTTIFLIALAAALIASLALISILEFFDHSVRSASGAEAELEMPVLGSIPELRGREARRLHSSVVFS